MMGAVKSIHTHSHLLHQLKKIHFPMISLCLSQHSYSFFVNYKRLNKITICKSHGDYVRNGYRGELRLIGYCVTRVAVAVWAFIQLNCQRGGVLLKGSQNDTIIPKFGIYFETKLQKLALNPSLIFVVHSWTFQSQQFPKAFPSVCSKTFTAEFDVVMNMQTGFAICFEWL